jgi:hypothetical protein
VKPRFSDVGLLWFLAAFLTVLLVVLLPFAISTKRFSSKTFFCDKCGIRLRVTTNEFVTSTNPVEQRTEDTELSRWFVTHITTICQHSWQFNHAFERTYRTLGRIRLWPIYGIAGSRSTPTIVYLFDDDRERLEKLSETNRDQCRTYIHARLQGTNTSTDE